MQIAEAAQYLHICNVVHRDLKPSNCLVSEKGGGGRGGRERERERGW